MSWIHVDDVMPAQNVQILIHDPANNRIAFGHYHSGHWYVERPDGTREEITGVTHWAVQRDAYEYDAGDD